MKNSSATWVIGAVIGIVIMLTVAAQLYPTFNDGLGDLANTSGLPLAGLFAQGGIIAILFIVALFYGAYRLLWSKK